MNALLQSPVNLLRRRKGGKNDNKVTFVELFFDLVFVFTIIQLSHSLSHHFTTQGIVEAFILMVSIWTVWIYTTWHLNWLDPDLVPVRVMIYVVMLAGLILSTAIPEAFGARGIYYAAAYSFIQVGRTLFIAWATHKRESKKHRSFVLILIWVSIAAVFWIVGGLSDPHARLYWWASAVAIEFFSPMIGFWVPGLGRTGPKDWDVSGGHMAERCGLFIIICLGEGICVNGAAFSDKIWTFGNVSAFFVSFLLTVLMWWNYFHCGQFAGSKRIEESQNPGKVAMWAYHYAHVPIVIGIVLLAVASYFLFKHPLELTDSKTAFVLISSTVIFFVGTISFKRLVSGNVPKPDIIGLTGILIASMFYSKLNSVMFAGCIALIFIYVAIIEYKAAHKFHAQVEESLRP